MRQIEKERPVFRTFDELDRLIAEPIGKILARFAFGECRDAPRSEIGVWSGFLRPGNVQVEAVVRRPVARPAEMPLADARRRVAGRMESVGDRLFFQRQVLGPIGHQQLGITGHRAGNPVGDVQPGGILAGQQGRPRRRTNSTGRIVLREPHPFLGQPVEARRFIQIASEAAQIGPAQVIGENEHDIGNTGRIGTIAAVYRD